MKISEKNFRETIKKNEPISEKVEERLLTSYDKISSMNRYQRHSFKRYYIVAAVFFLGISLWSFTPFGYAIMNYIKFGQFTSETLNKAGFVKKSDKVVVNKETSVGVKQMYIDQSNLGIQFEIQLPKESKLLSEKLTDYSVHFSIKNRENQYLVDFNSGTTNQSETSNYFDSMSKEQYIDKQSHTLTVAYVLHAKIPDNLPDFEDTTIEVTKISAMEKSKPKAGAGFSKIKGESVYGKWIIPIDQKNMKSFEPINFTQDNKQTLVVKQATAYPTTFVVKIDKNKLEKLPDPKGPKTYQLTIKKGREEKSIPYTKAELVNEEGKEYIQVTFDYSGYDQYSELLLKISQNGNIRLVK
ncbi:hypothetical protein ACSG6T_002696 [Enterococcus faecalis]